MIRKLNKHGEEFVLVIDRAMLDQLGIDETTPLEISTDGKTLVVSPAQDDDRDKRFQQAMAEGNRRYEKTLKRLAE